MDTLIFSILSVVAVTNIILALIIFARGFRQLSNIIFGLIALSSAIWSMAIVGFYSTQFHSLINWIHVSHSSAILIPLLFLIFSLYFPQKLKNREKISIFTIIVTLIISYFIFFSDLIIGETHGNAYNIGIGYSVYAIILSSYFLLGYLFLWRQYKGAVEEIQKKQVQYVLVGSFIASTLAIVPDLILPYVGIFEFTWLGPIFTLLMVISLFMAMLKYHLFNIKVILTEVISIVIVVALLLELFSAQSSSEIFLKSIVLVIVTCFAYLLIKGVYKEVEQREHIQLLATDLQKANDRLTELDRQKSEFVSFATHQLRAPLTAMKGYASLILEGDTGKISDETRNAITRIFDSTNTLTNIVNDYLNIARIELGSMKYAFETIDLKTLVEDVIAELKPNIEKSNLKFSFEAENAGTNYRITADRDKLKQVIANLIDNSVKYTPSGFVKVTLNFDRSRHKFVFKVTDSGIGISTETMPLLFQKFGRAHNANKVNIKGTGLGLYVAKDIINAHNGKIWAESPGEGKGSTFFVEFEPFAKA